MSIKFLVLRGGGISVLGGGGKCRFYFYGRADFSEFRLMQAQGLASTDDSFPGKRTPFCGKKKTVEKRVPCARE